MWACAVFVWVPIYTYEARNRRVSFIRRLSRSSFPRRRRTVNIKMCFVRIFHIILYIYIGMSLRLVWDNASGSLHMVTAVYYDDRDNAHEKRPPIWPWGIVECDMS